MGPPPRLRGLVRRLWYVEDADAAGREVKLPGVAPQVLINLDADRLSARPSGASDPSVVSGAGFNGLGHRAVELDLAEQRRLVGVVLEPGAVPALFGLSAAALTGPLLDLGDVTAGATRWADRCWAALPAGPRAVLATLGDQLVPRSEVRPDPGLCVALRLLAQGWSVAAVAERLGRSQSGLLRAFRHGLGLSPKAAQRRLRLARAVRSVRAGGDLAEVADRTGYADQSHLTHEFVDLTGLTPGEYRDRAGPSPMHVRLDG